MSLFGWLFGQKPTVEPRREPVRQTIPEPEFASEWDVANIAQTEIERPDGMVALTGASNIRVAGLNHREAEVTNFIRVTRAAYRGGRGWGTLTLVREPENPHDANAVKILAAAPGSRQTQVIGYLPADIAYRLATDFDPAMPIAAVLRAVGNRRGGDGPLIKLDVLIPRKADRKRFERG